MGFCTYHIQKGKASAGGLGNHIDRVKGFEHSFNNADPTRTHLNISYPCNGYEKMSLPEAIEKRIKEGYNARNKAGELKEIRKDACRFSEHVFTGTHEDMKAIEADPQRLQEWVRENRRFAEEMYGADNIVRFTLHLDEKTPHIHCIIVNLTKDGRLSAKDILGNPKELQKKQDKYAEYMRPFGLERGLKDTGIKHENAKEYYKRINNSLDEMKDLEVWEDKTNIFGQKSGEKKLNVEKTLQNYINQNTSLKDEKDKMNASLMGLWFQRFGVEKLERDLKIKEEDLRRREELIIQEEEKNRDILQTIQTLQDNIRKLESSREWVNSEFEKLKGKNQELKLELLKLQELKKYEGLTKTREYIDESLILRDKFELINAIGTIRRLNNEPQKYKDKEELYEDFKKEMKKAGFTTIWTSIKDKFDKLEEEMKIEYAKEDIKKGRKIGR
jgi:hypothetical protein